MCELRLKISEKPKVFQFRKHFTERLYKYGGLM